MGYKLLMGDAFYWHSQSIVWIGYKHMISEKYLIHVLILKPKFPDTSDDFKSKSSKSCDDIKIIFSFGDMFFESPDVLKYFLGSPDASDDQRKIFLSHQSIG